MKDTNDTIFSPQTEILHVTVTEQYCRMDAVGTRSFRNVKTFAIHVRDDFGNERKIELPEELYDAFEVGQLGTLTLVDGEVYSFELDGDDGDGEDALPYSPDIL
jgi:hypothetical protein